MLLPGGGASRVSLVHGFLATGLKEVDAVGDQGIDLVEFEKAVVGNSPRIQMGSGLSQCLALYRARVLVPRQVRRLLASVPLLLRLYVRWRSHESAPDQPMRAVLLYALTL
jgi:hypothetical protein